MSPLLFCRFAQTSAAVLLAGTVVLRLLARGTGHGGAERWGRLAFGSWGALLVAGVFQLALTAADMNGVPLSQAFSRDVLGSVLGGTLFGVVWAVRMALLAGLLIVGIMATASTARDGMGALLAAALLASLVWTGHAQASERAVWLLPMDVLHAITAGVWPGGLLPLALLLAKTRRDPHLTQPAVTITRRFSRLSIIAVGILALSGLLDAYALVGTFSALWPSVYGRWLICKVTIFAGMVILGAMNRRLIRPDAATLRSLWRNVAWECVLAAGVLLATEALATSAPPVS